MAINPNSKAGKCTNFGNCTLADARTTIEVPTGLDFVCTECHKPLLLAEVGGPSRNRTPLVVAAIVAVLLVAAGGAWYYQRSHATPPIASPTTPPAVVAAPPVVPPAAQAAPVPESPAPSGHCSPEDARRGLCTPVR
jgi:hypothetical protein